MKVLGFFSCSVKDFLGDSEQTSESIKVSFETLLI